MIKERLNFAAKEQKSNKDSLEKFADRVKNGGGEVIVRGDFRGVSNSQTRFSITCASGQNDVFSEVYREPVGKHKNSERKKLRLLVTVEDRRRYFEGKLGPDVRIIGQVNGSDIMTDPDRYKEMLSKAKDKGIKPLGKQMVEPPTEIKIPKKPIEEPKFTGQKLFNRFYRPQADVYVSVPPTENELQRKSIEAEVSRVDPATRKPVGMESFVDMESPILKPELILSDESMNEGSFVDFVSFVRDNNVDKISFSSYYREKVSEEEGKPITYMECGIKIQTQIKETDEHIFLQPHKKISKKLFDILSIRDKKLIELKLLATSDYYSSTIEEGLHIPTKGPLDNSKNETKKIRADIRNKKIAPFTLPALE